MQSNGPAATNTHAWFHLLSQTYAQKETHRRAVSQAEQFVRFTFSLLVPVAVYRYGTVNK